MVEWRVNGLFLRVVRNVLDQAIFMDLQKSKTPDKAAFTNLFVHYVLSSVSYVIRWDIQWHKLPEVPLPPTALESLFS